MENNDIKTIIKVNGPISLNTSVELPIDGLPLLFSSISKLSTMFIIVRESLSP